MLSFRKCRPFPRLPPGAPHLCWLSSALFTRTCVARWFVGPSPGWDHVPFISLSPLCGIGLAEWALHKEEQASLVGGGAVTSQAMTQFLRVAPPEHDGEALRPHISLQTAHRDHLTLWRASEEGASHLHFRDEETGVRVGWVTCPSTGLWGYWQSWDLNPGPGVGLH